MKITIVTLSFNQCKFLRDAIDSVVNQNYAELEYIVVDPGSTDGSREILRQYSSHFSGLLLEPDAGAADGLNKGFARATGAIYGFLNADDTLLPGALEAVADCFEDNRDIDIVMGDGFITDEDGRHVRHIKAASFTPLRLIYGGTTSLQQSTFFRSSAYAQGNGFNVSNKTSWDLELFLDLIQRGATIKYLRANLATFRVHGASITGTGRANEAYQHDRLRLFSMVRGREWTASDNLRAIYYKGLRFLADPPQLLNTLWDRFRKSYPVAAARVTMGQSPIPRS